MRKFSMIAALVLGAGIALPAAAAAPAAAVESLTATLKIGDKAPDFAVESFIKGDEFEKFQEGHVYVVEFWATWCGPCIAMMPHMSQMQKEYKDEGVTFVGVNMEEWDPSQLTAETKTKVKDFVKEQGSRMDYTVVYDGAEGAMAKGFFQAAEQQGIPCAFVVDQKSRVAWFGHPMWLGEVISAVADDKWDFEKGPAHIAEGEEQLDALFMKAGSDAKSAVADFHKFEKEFPEVAKLAQRWLLPTFFEAGEYGAAYAAANAMADEAIASKDSSALNELAWTIVDPSGSVEKKDLALAKRCAKAACEITEYKDAAILDTLARVYFLEGNIDEAIKIQTAAVENAPRQMKAELESALKEYKDAKGRG